MKNKVVMFLIVSLIGISLVNCSSNPENVAELTAPIVYSLVKNAIEQDKCKGKLIIKVEYENLKNEKTGWPSGEVRFDVEMNEYKGKHVLVTYILDGTHNATATIKIPGKDKKQVKVNLYERAIVFGQAQVVENTIKEISNKISKKMKSNAKVAIFDFVDLNNRNLIFGQRISESMITYMLDQNKVVVERKLLDKVLLEAAQNQTGLTNDETLKNMGKLLGADEIVVGTIKVENEEILINSRVIELSSGIILASAQGIIPKYLVNGKDLSSK